MTWYPIAGLVSECLEMFGIIANKLQDFLKTA